MKFGKSLPLLLCSLILIAFYSCQKTEEPCNTNNPAVDFPWLQMHLDTIDREPCNIEAHIFRYGGNQVIYVIGCSDLDESSLVFDCSGSVICEFRVNAGINTCPDFDSTNEYVGQIYPD